MFTAVEEKDTIASHSIHTNVCVHVICMCVVCLCVVWFVCGVGYSRERECNEIALMKREVMKRWKGEGKGEGKGKKRHSEG